MAPAAEWAPPSPAAPLPGRAAGSGLRRYVAALKRYKWLLLPALILGALGGFIATRFVHPQYEAQARIVISNEAMSTGSAWYTCLPTRTRRR